MTVNSVAKTCTVCGTGNADILGAMTVVETVNNKQVKVSYNLYKCIGSNPKKAHKFRVKRKGDKKEQELTQKFIDSSRIILKQE